MRPDARRGAERGGFALVAALVILVLLAALGSTMLRLTGTEQASASLALLGSRAHFAARSGIEWALRESVAAGGCPAPTTTLTLAEGALAGFRVEVSCSPSLHAEGSRTRTQLALRARAEFATAGSRDHVVREVAATVGL